MKRAKKPCNKMSCNNLTSTSYCELHQEEKKIETQRYNQGRNKEHKAFYNSKVWKEVRRVALIRDNFICVMCKKDGRVTKGEHIDHIKEMTTSEGWSRRADIDNLQTLCKECHNKKTAEEKGKRK